MATFKYTAKDMDAKKITGKMEANDRKELAAFLRSDGKFLIECKDVTNIEKNTYILKLKELSDFSRQLGTMIGSGVSLIRAISILVQRQKNPKIKAIYTDIYRKLQQGMTLSYAMEEQGKAFPELMINMYRTGETSGQMERVAMTMALQYEKDNRIKGKVRNAMIYPIILICVTIFVVIGVFTFIIPSFSKVFNGMELPMITKIVNAISEAMLALSLIHISKTKFEMRGKLPSKEPGFQKRWKEQNIYEKMLKKREGCEPFVLHDGPPYANGDIHLGHALNKILKDVIIRSKFMDGYKVPYIPGWDTHGLPIETAIQKLGHNRKEMELADFRKLCYNYAMEQVEKQKAGFLSLGVVGDYDHPYITLTKEFEAHQIEIFGKMAMNCLLYTS